MKPDYEINIDPDMAHKDTITIFVNHKVYDFNGKFIGATGVGLNVNAVVNLIKHYHQKYARDVSFVDKSGKVVLSSSDTVTAGDNIFKLEGLSPIAGKILANRQHRYEYWENGRVVYLNTRFISELNWYLLVSQTENSLVKNIFNTLIANLVLCAIITLFVLIVTWITINTFQKKLEVMVVADKTMQERNQHQQDEINHLQQVLKEKDAHLDAAVEENRQLSCLLPVCSSCKRIKSKDGKWEKLDSHLDKTDSDTKFSHCICPECTKKLYPDL